MSITLIIIVLTVIVSASTFNNQELFAKLKYNPYMVYHRKEWYRFVTHAFLHADWMHLLVNMYVLYMFGALAEENFLFAKGSKGFLYFAILYVGGVLFASLPSYKKHRENHYYSSVGASGAVAAVLFSSIMFEPTRSLGILFLPIPIPAFILGILYLAYEYYMDKKSQDNIAHDAHFWGALFGVSFTLLTVPETLSHFVVQIVNFIF